MVFPNLGYKKDAFLEPSLVSNISLLLPTSKQHHVFPNTSMSSNQSTVGDVGSVHHGLSGPAVPGSSPMVLPIDRHNSSTRSREDGGEMIGPTFVTIRGDCISCPHGRRPQLSQIGAGPYLPIDQVGEGLELGVMDMRKNRTFFFKLFILSYLTLIVINLPTAYFVSDDKENEIAHVIRPTRGHEAIDNKTSVSKKSYWALSSHASTTGPPGTPTLSPDPRRTSLDRSPHPKTPHDQSPRTMPTHPLPPH